MSVLLVNGFNVAFKVIARIFRLYCLFSIVKRYYPDI